MTEINKLLLEKIQILEDCLENKNKIIEEQASQLNEYEGEELTKL